MPRYPKVGLKDTSSAYPAGYHDGILGGLPALEPDLIPINIAWGIEIFGVVGNNPATYLDRWIAASIFLSHALAVIAANHNINKGAPITSAHVETTGDLPASLVKQFTPAITLPKAAAIIVPNHTITRAPAIGRQFDLQMVVQGAFRSPLGVDTDETAAAQSAAANDMSLPPQTPGATDAYKFGHPKQFDVLRIDVGTAGVWNGAITWKYWNGAWVALAGVTDGTNGFRNAGINEVTFTRPGDWAVQNLGGLGNQYYIMPDVTAFIDRTIQPLGTQAWIRIIT